jgi:glutamine synthetase type III
MVSKSTKSIASRIPLDLYFQLIREADELELNMKDYLLKIIESRHEKQQIDLQDKQESTKEKILKPVKQVTKKSPKVETNTSEILFPTE